jgi:FAD/FMN-containing dehydrogenase
MNTGKSKIYEQKKESLLKAFQEVSKNNSSASIALSKKTSNLFRPRSAAPRAKLPVRDFNQVINVDTEKQLVEVEGMTTYEDLVEETLKHNFMPAVVPELKTITIGGAATGIGIEATSFKYGFVHETIEEMEILTGTGQVVTVRRDNEYQDLFRGFPNSYGTLGYAIKITAKIIPVKKFVHVTYLHFTDQKSFFEKMEELCNSKVYQNKKVPVIPSEAAAESRNPSSESEKGISPLRPVSDGTSVEMTMTDDCDLPIDFLDGVVFSKNEFVISLGIFTDEAPYVNDYTKNKIYYQSIRTKNEDYLTTKDYIWRWDTDWFWCSSHFGVQNPVLRRFVPKKYLRSDSYWKIRSYVQQHTWASKLLDLMGKTEPVVQDVEIPIENASSYLDFFQEHIGIKPIWVCPVRAYNSSIKYDLYSLEVDKLYVNFGFWDTVPTKHEEGYYNRQIEKKVMELKGKKSLYSSSFYPKDEFWSLYNKAGYEELKKKYDPNKRFKDLYEKCVLRG